MHFSLKMALEDALRRRERRRRARTKRLAETRSLPSTPVTQLQVSPKRIDTQLPLAGYRILVVHADMIVALELVSQLECEGAEIVGPAHGLAQALKCAEEPRMSGAVLNFIVDRVLDTTPVAERLRQRGIPVLFYTAMDPGSMTKVAAPLNAEVLTAPRGLRMVGCAVASLVRGTKY